MKGRGLSGGSRRGWWTSRRALLLFGIWVGALVLAVVLHVSTPGFLAFRGVAELVEFHPSVAERVVVRSVPVEIGQWVRAGDVVAVLDGVVIRGELETLKAELAFAEAELDAQSVLLARETLTDRRRFEDGVDRAESSLQEARTRLEEARAELKGVQERIRWWSPMVESRSAPGDTLGELRAEAAVLERRVTLEAQAVRKLDRVVERSRARMSAFQAAAPDGDEARAAETGLAPYRAQVEVLRAKVADYQARLDAMTLRAPGDGVVYKIDVRPGDTAVPGEPVVQIRAPTTRRVTAYVSDVVASMLTPGGGVTVLPRDAAGRQLRGRVLALGSGLRPLPEQALLNPNWREFGEEVLVELEDEGALYPGQVVDVRFDLGRGVPADLVVPVADAAPTVEAAGPGGRPAGPEGTGAGSSEPAPVEVPEALAHRTRVEPSGLAWAAELDRFLVVSDDTGHGDQHLPLLLAMDRAGRLDPVPVPVDGVEELNDLEAIARAPDGTFWLLSAQSVSRKGNRPESRTLLVPARLDGRRLVATGRVSLASALAAAGDDAWLAALGLEARAPGFKKGVAGFDRLLNIEGMAWDGDALVLGLKRPLDAEGRAILWRLARPGRLVETGRLAREDLVVQARPALSAGGRSAGVSDLAALPGGGLALLAVAAGEAGDAGAMYVLPPAGSADPAPRKLRDFPGRKPEGVATGPEAGTLWILFDQDAATPAWMSLPVPR